MGTGKSLLADTVIQNVEYKCNFDDCEEVFEIDKLDEHESICVHRLVLCPSDGCDKTIPLSQILDHLGELTCSYGRGLGIFFPAWNNENNRFLVHVTYSLTTNFMRLKCYSDIYIQELSNSPGAHF